MKKFLPWIALLITTAVLLFVFVVKIPVQQGGDIVEYYGITQSVLNHAGVALSPEDQAQLEQVLHPGYFKDPGYYVPGTTGERFPVHFFFYSLIAVPIRWLLQIAGFSPLKSLAVTNVLIFALTCTVIFKRYLKRVSQQFVFLAVFLISPLMSFFIWPGPDLLYVCLLTLSLCAFFKKDYLAAVLTGAVASWHSQPLMVYTAGITIYAAIEACHLHLKDKQFKKIWSRIPWFKIVSFGLVSLLVFIPYAYNFYAFGVLTPWTILADGWTKLNGFGLQNLSLLKLYEQFFDLNMGLLWYAPLELIAGLVISAWLIFKRKNYRLAFIFIVMIATAFFYQTNPAWHYGTSGYGPSRHILFFVAYLSFVLGSYLKFNRYTFNLLVVIIASQLMVLSFNNFLNPDLTNSLKNSYIATAVLQHWPQLYNPTPEIFVDRTNHTDLGFPTSAIYKVNGTCYKAYILATDKNVLLKACGYIPDRYQAQLDDPFSASANYERSAVIYQATLWPNSASCDSGYQPTAIEPYVCLKDATQVAERITGNASRITTVPGYEYPGVWKITLGDPMTIHLPPGYIMQYQGVEGVYVNYP